MDKKNQAALIPLLRFESSTKGEGEVSSMDEYIERFEEGQKEIYFLHSPSRQTALVSPYYEQFKKKGIEVLFMYGQLDEYLMSEYMDRGYKDYKFVSVENSDIKLDEIKSKNKVDDADSDTDTQGDGLTPGQTKRFRMWLTKVLGSKINDAQSTDRLSDSPIVLASGFEQSAVYRHMKQVAGMQGNKSEFEGMLGQQKIEFNPKHPIVQRLYWLSRSKDFADEEKAKLMADQLYDNALIAAGLLNDPRMMLSRLNSLLSDALNDVEIGIEEEPEIEPEVEVDEPKAPNFDQDLGPGSEAKYTPEMDKVLQNMIKEEIKDGRLNQDDLKAMAEKAIMEQSVEVKEVAKDMEVQDAEFKPADEGEGKKTSEKAQADK